MPLSPEAIAALVSVPAALAVIVTVWLFLKHDDKQRTADRKERAADRLIWENHLSGTVEVLTELRDEVRELRRETRVVVEVKK